MKTAVEQLIHELNLIERIQINGKDVIQIELSKLDGILDKAKEMFEKQIIEAYNTGVWDLGCKSADSEEYYNRTFKQQEQ